MGRPNIVKRAQKVVEDFVTETHDLAEQQADERSMRQGREAWYKQKNVSRGRKWAVGQRMRKLDKQ